MRNSSVIRLMVKRRTFTIMRQMYFKKSSMNWSKPTRSYLQKRDPLPIMSKLLCNRTQLNTRKRAMRTSSAMKISLKFRKNVRRKLLENPLLLPRKLSILTLNLRMSLKLTRSLMMIRQMMRTLSRILRKSSQRPRFPRSVRSRPSILRSRRRSSGIFPPERVS